MRALSLILIATCFYTAHAEELSYPDLIFLANGQSMQVLLDKLPSPDDKEVLIKTPGGGELSLTQALIAEIRPGLDYRLANANQKDHAEQIELARYCIAAQRKEDALKLLKAAHKQKALKPAQLRSLAQLTDQFEGPEAAIPLYKSYRDQGGKDVIALARLKTLEAAIAAHKAKVEEIFAKNPAARKISEGLEVKTNWRSENIKWANSLKVKNHPLPMGENRVNTVLQVDYKGGDKYKASVVLQTKIDVREQNLFTFYASNPSDKAIRLSIAVKCGDRWEYYESRTKTLSKQAVWEQISFDLKRSDFKSQATSWQHKDTIKEPHAIREIQILMHNDRNDGTIMFDGIGFSKSNKEM